MLRGGLGSQEDRQPGSRQGTPCHPQTQCRPGPRAAMCPPLSGCGVPGQLETPVGLGGCPHGKVLGLWLDPAEDREDDAPSDALAPPPLPASVPWGAQVHQKGAESFTHME